MKKTKTIKRLESIIESFGYKVIYKKHKSMNEFQQGVTCPDIEKIYIDPKNCQDIPSTLAHEIGHIILLYAQTPGHSEHDDNEFDLMVAENAADEIGIVICKCLGHVHDFPNISEKSVKQISWAKNRYKTEEEIQAFIDGYCFALSDVLVSSEVVLGEISELLKKVFAETTDIKLQRRAVRKWHKRQEIL